MLLSDFIRELKHKSLWLNIIDVKPAEDKAVYCGTMGELIHDVKYLNTYSKYSVAYIQAQYTYDMKNSLFIYIQEVV